MKILIEHNKPTIGKEEADAILKVIYSGWIAQGNEVEKFENEFSDFLGFGPGHAIAVSSGTAAIYILLLALGIKSGDEVITSTYVCSAVLNAIFLAKAKPVLVDIDCNFNISFEQTKKKINSKTKAIIVPHIFGMPADVDKFIKLKIPIIEDCAQAIGSKLNGKYVGTFGKAAIFSFYASKMITTGYGGMVFSKDKVLIKKIDDYRQFDCRKEYKPRFNFHMSDILAAMGRAQLKKLPSLLKERRMIANKYYQVLPVGKVWPAKNCEDRQPNYYRFLLCTDQPSKIRSYLEKKGIKTIVPIETFELLHRYLKQKPADFPISEKIAKATLSLPVYPSLTTAEIKKIITNIKYQLENK